MGRSSTPIVRTAPKKYQEQTLNDEGYRQRCRDAVAKWRQAFKAKPKADSGQQDSTSKPTYAQLKAQIEALQTQLRGRLHFKVSEKGAVSVYGLGRFPVTLYYEQWVRLLEVEPELREFLESSKERLNLKEP